MKKTTLLVFFALPLLFGEVLISGQKVFAADPPLSIAQGGTGIGSFNAGSVLFSNGNRFAEDYTNFFWDDTNNRLGIGTSTPTTTLDVSGNAKVMSLTSSGDALINNLTVGLGGGANATNTAIGKDALLNNTSAVQSTALGYEALFANGGVRNTAVGFVSLSNGIANTGSENTAVGAYALRNNTGNYNSAIGSNALHGNSTGDANTAVGLAALMWNRSGSNNVGLGYYALNPNTTGSNNVAIGERAGFWQVNGQLLTTSQDSIYIGMRARGYDDSDVNSIVIGTEAQGAGANKAVIGNSQVGDVYFGSSAGRANVHAKKMLLGSSAVPGCIIMGDSDGSGVSYITVNDGVLSVSVTAPSICQ